MNSSEINHSYPVGYASQHLYQQPRVTKNVLPGDYADILRYLSHKTSNLKAPRRHGPGSGPEIVALGVLVLGSCWAAFKVYTTQIIPEPTLLLYTILEPCSYGSCL